MAHEREILRLFYKTRNVSTCFWGVFSGVGLPEGYSWAANRGGVSPKNSRRGEKGSPSSRGMFPEGGALVGESVLVGRNPGKEKTVGRTTTRKTAK